MIGDQVASLLSTLTLLANVFICFLILAFLFSRVSKKGEGLWGKIVSLAKKYFLEAAFFVSLVATVGSLISSEFLNLAPCELCWYQRVFMYPLTFLLATALVKKERKQVAIYALPLAVSGGLIAFYQYYLQATFNPLSPCSEELVSCTQRYINGFGFITIPWMSLTAFLLIILFFLLSLSKTKSR